ncbi:sensor histidine kinase [Paenibacillus silvisoli]|uniref:sensor histidine kinase n=1 Tax=Paenibacillus silvisoli TaxID=3110539 RepID=UPI00280394B1|nr:sensor histidine kinase [Paenibacillus silvisoli]
MPSRFSIFHKIILFIVCLLVPIVGLYMYSNRVSVSVVQSEIEDSIGQRLAFLQNRLNLQVDHLARGAFQLGGDPILQSYGTMEGFESYFDVIEFKRRAEERISIQDNMSEWPTASTVYFPKTRQVISPTAFIQYDQASLEQQVSNSWRSRPNGIGGHSFYFYAASSFSGYTNPGSADRIVEIRFEEDNLIRMLNDYKATGQGDPFLYHAEQGTIFNGSFKEPLTSQVINQIKGRKLADPDSFQAELSGSAYLVYTIRTKLDGWILVDYVPLQQVLAPIVSSNQLFYASTLLLLLLSVFAAFMLYRHVQIPIHTLVKSLRQVHNGDLATRIHAGKSNEFRFVFQRFNDMIERIQQLIEHVYTEQLRSRDAQLKQLQAQINPHFLYNCLYFIVNMARLERLDSIEKMALNLGSYFKYTTRLEKPDTTVQEELELVVNYLEIQQLRMRRIEYAIDVPEPVRGLEMPRLMLQPVVENAVIHGIEPKPGGGRIDITGGMEGDFAWLDVQDNGIGMTEEQVSELSSKLRGPMDPSIGHGIWNVNQRLVLRFGEGSGVQYRRGRAGGLTVRLTWKPEANVTDAAKGGEGYVSGTYRR